MGNLFNKSPPSNSVETRQLTAEEKDHLILLGSTAGVPGIVMDAVKSGNIFDPAHMERAKAIGQQWEDGSALLAPILERQKRFEEAEEQLIEMGKQMDGEPVQTSYAYLESKVVGMGTPQPDWFLRIETAEGNHVDMTLAPNDEIINCSILLATRYVPRFKAHLCCPQPVLVYEHSGV